MDSAVDSLTEDVYLTIDIDGLDPSLVPSTGTPEPGGLMWNEVLALIRTLAAKRNVVGMDLVELCRSRQATRPVFWPQNSSTRLWDTFRSQVPQL